jgi:hypothetical protein
MSRSYTSSPPKRLHGVYRDCFMHNFCQSRWPRGLRRSSWPLGYCNRGFEFRSRHGCFSLCFCVVLSCVGRGLWRRADHSSKEVLPCVLIRSRSLRCEAAKILTGTVEPLMMMMMYNVYSWKSQVPTTVKKQAPYNPVRHQEDDFLSEKLWLHKHNKICQQMFALAFSCHKKRHIYVV